MPKTTNAQAAKQYHALGKPYDAFAEVFDNSMKEEESHNRLIAEANAGSRLWSDVSRLSFSITSSAGNR